MFDLSLFLPTHYFEPKHYASIMTAIAAARKNSNIEVVVSDNSGNSEKLAYLRKFEAANVSIVEGPADGNHAFAMEKTTGRFVMAVGDDDVLLPAPLGFMLERLKASNDYIGACGVFCRDLGSQYDFHSFDGLNDKEYPRRIQSLVNLIPYGNSLFHAIVDREVTVKAYHLWFSIPNRQAYHDQIMTLYLACSGPFALFNQPYFIFSFSNWQGLDQRIASEIKYLKSDELPCSILLLQRLMLAVEGYFLVNSHHFSNSTDDRVAAANAWCGAWFRYWVGSLSDGYQNRKQVADCPFLSDVMLIVDRYRSADHIVPANVLTDLSKLYEKINGTGTSYFRFWTTR